MDDHQIVIALLRHLEMEEIRIGADVTEQLDGDERFTTFVDRAGRLVVAEVSTEYPHG